jgi:ribosome-associated heat shock protein Hsp15
LSSSRPAPLAERQLEGRDWQRLDLWLWCARVMKARSDCARLVESGGVRLNSQPTVKAHARVRPGDVITLGLRQEVRVLRVVGLAERRGPAPAARMLYLEIAELAPRSESDLADREDHGPREVTDI